MKKILTMLIFLAIGSAQAEEELTKQETCSRLSALAEAVMTKRQEGVAMSKLMEAGGDEPIMSRMIASAYKETRYSTETMKRRQIDDFRDEYYLYCWDLE